MLTMNINFDQLVGSLNNLKKFVNDGSNSFPALAIQRVLKLFTSFLVESEGASIIHITRPPIVLWYQILGEKSICKNHSNSGKWEASFINVLAMIITAGEKTSKLKHPQLAGSLQNVSINQSNASDTSFIVVIRR